MFGDEFFDGVDYCGYVYVVFVGVYDGNGCFCGVDVFCSVGVC